jgi:hypothetical protein
MRYAITVMILFCCMQVKAGDLGRFTYHDGSGDIHMYLNEQLFNPVLYIETNNSPEEFKYSFFNSAYVRETKDRKSVIILDNAKRSAFYRIYDKNSNELLMATVLYSNNKK